MKKITLFYLDDCPYCHYAKRALAELADENPAYGEIQVDWIEEREQPEISAQYDYYYVPTIFYGEEKLYEAHPTEKYEDCKKNIKAALDIALNKE